MLGLLYITRAHALEAGMTHEGTLFGLPAWFADDADEITMATPKVPILHLWCQFADWCFELASWVTPGDMVLVSPIKIKNRIE